MIVADTKFFPKEIIQKNKFISIFPDKCNGKAKIFDLDELQSISRDESVIIDELTDKLIEIFLKEKIYENKDFRVFLRQYCAGILAIFIDRSLRTLDFVNNNNINDLSIIDSEDLTLHLITDILIDAPAHSWQFNQNLFCKLFSNFNINRIKIFSENNYPEYDEASMALKNLLFLPPERNFIWKLINELQFRVPKFRKSIPSFGFAQDEFFLGKAGFFGPFGIFKKMKLEPIITSNKDVNLRKKISYFTKPLLTNYAFNILRKHDKLSSDKNIMKVISSFSNIFADYYPTSLLEKAKDNYLIYYNKLKNYKSKYIISHNFTGAEAIFAACAAKSLNKKTIGYQHGGQYGYVADLYQFAQSEYEISDYFATWGWSDDEIDEYFPKFKSFSLPVPQFSESFKDIYKIDVSEFSKRADIFYISNKTNRYPFSCAGGTNRVDFVEKFKEGIERIVKLCNQRDYSIVVKVYSKNRYLMLKEFWDDLKNMGGNNFSFYDVWDKGLSERFLSTAKLIVWDQIGTGTLQCLTLSVPTMVLWERYHSRETRISKKYIDKLRDVGVIHNNVNEFDAEFQNFLKDPLKWMKDSKRQTAIKEFCDRYSNVHPRWKKIWKKTFKENFLIK